MAIDINFGALQTANPFAAYAQGQEIGQQQRLNKAKQAAGNLFSTDPAQAAQIMAAAGDPESAIGYEKIGASRKTAASRSRAAQLYSGGNVKGAREEALGSGDSEFLAQIDKLDEQQKVALHERETAIAGIGYTLKPLPYEQRKQKLAAMAAQPPAGVKAEDLTGFDPTDDNINSRVSQSLGIAKMIELGKPVEMDPTKNYYQSDLAGSAPAASGQAPAAAQPANGPQTNDVFGALIAQESGGRPGVTGPQTPYGRAQGMTQMLPATAQGMAQKLGVAWRPDLMTGTSPEAAQYQQQLGRAYFEEGLQKYGGDVQKALMYYHGGPNEAIWGPKTHAYAQNVLARVQGAPQGDAQPYQVASNGPTPPPPSIPGYHPLQQARPQWAPDGKGSLVNPVTGDRKTDPSYKGHAEIATPPGLTKVGANVYRDAVGRVYQPDAQGNMKQTYGVTDGAVSKATEEITGLNAMLAAATEYESAVKALKPTDFGPKGNYLGDPAKFGRAQAAATNLMMLAKGPAMYNLGVITGPDMEILGGVIENPSRWGALIRQGQIMPKLHSFAAGIGTKYTMLANGFKAQGGDPEGLPGLYGAQRQNGRWVVPGGRSGGAAKQQPSSSVKTEGNGWRIVP